MGTLATLGLGLLFFFFFFFDAAAAWKGSTGASEEGCKRVGGGTEGVALGVGAGVEVGPLMTKMESDEAELTRNGRGKKVGRIGRSRRLRKGDETQKVDPVSCG
jgi:hypothetical protein